MTQLKMVLAGTICVVGLLAGCGTRTVLIPPGEPVRLRAPVKAKIWAADNAGKEVPGEVILPEGWYALPDPGIRKTSAANAEFENPFVVTREGKGDGVLTKKIFADRPQ